LAKIDPNGIFRLFRKASFFDCNVNIAEKSLNSFFREELIQCIALHMH
jgi:hypothetical protein